MNRILGLQNLAEPARAASQPESSFISIFICYSTFSAVACI